MRIGNLQLRSNLILAPMSGITDYPFRRLAKEMGCGLVFTGLVSAEGFLQKRNSFLKIKGHEHPLVVQLVGSNPSTLAAAAERVEAMGADVIDINMGCPAEQVTKVGAGADLMRFPLRIEKILTEIRKRVKVPLTIKIRSGWDKKHINSVEISKRAEACGVDAITLHPRTKEQGLRGRADWELIKEVKMAVRVPIIGNGDVKTQFLAEKMQNETGCDGVMIGRGALGNPWIFSQEIVDFSPSPGERLKTIEHHFLLLQEDCGDQGAITKIRKHAAWYAKGLPESTSFRSRLPKIKEKEKMVEVIQSYFDSIKRREPWPLSSSREKISAIG